jgi:hypothetical protein
MWSRDPRRLRRQSQRTKPKPYAIRRTNNLQCESGMAGAAMSGGAHGQTTQPPPTHVTQRSEHSARFSASSDELEDREQDRMKRTHIGRSGSSRGWVAMVLPVPGPRSTHHPRLLLGQAVVELLTQSVHAPAVSTNFSGPATIRSQGGTYEARRRTTTPRSHRGRSRRHSDPRTGRLGARVGANLGTTVTFTTTASAPRACLLR